MHTSLNGGGLNPPNPFPSGYVTGQSSFQASSTDQPELHTMSDVRMAVETPSLIIQADLDITGFCPRFCPKLNFSKEMLVLYLTKLEGTGLWLT